MAIVKKTGFILLGVFGALFALLLLSYLGFCFYFQNKTLPNTKYLGENIGLIEYAKLPVVMNTITESRLNFSYSLSLRGTVKSFKLSELDAKINVQKQIDEVKGKKLFNFFIDPKDIYFSGLDKVRTVPEVAFGESFEKKITESFQDQIQKAKDASIEIDDNNKYYINEGNGETKLNFNSLKSQIAICLKDNCKKNLIIAYSTTAQSVTKTDIDRFLPDIESLSQKKFSLQIGYKKYWLTISDKIGLIDVAETKKQSKLAFSKNKTCDFLNSISSKYTVKMKKKQISDIDGSIISEGKEGLTIDTDNSCEEVANALGNGDDTVKLATKEIPIEEETISPGYNPGKWEGKFIEVNLTQQTMYLFEGKDLKATYRVSTGKWSMPTPTGEFKIENKTDRAYSATYGLYMPWWMGFIGTEYGIHELPEWPNGAKEGEDHLGVPVSHGCVRLGVGSAEAVYSFAEVGTPVFIHT